MKVILKRLLVAGFIIVLTLVAFLATRPSFFKPHQPFHEINTPKPFNAHLAVLLLQQQKQNASSGMGAHGDSGRQVRAPAPLDHLSKEEERSFPKAVVVEAAEIEGPEADQKLRLRILKTNFKYPFIRTEELVDTYGVITRSEMVADHFLVTLPPSATPEAFLKKMGLQATLITRVTPDAALYRVDLSTSSLSALPRGLEKGSEFSGAICEPDFVNHL